MRQILGRVQQVADLMKAVDAASAERARGIAQVRRSVAGMDEATRQNAAMVEQAAAAAETMRAQAEQLTDVVTPSRSKTFFACMHVSAAFHYGKLMFSRKLA